MESSKGYIVMLKHQINEVIGLSVYGKNTMSHYTLEKLAHNLRKNYAWNHEYVKGLTDGVLLAHSLNSHARIEEINQHDIFERAKARIKLNQTMKELKS